MDEREVTESDALGGVQAAIGDAYIAGEIDALTANGLLADYVGMREKDRKLEIGKLNYKRDTGEAYSAMKDAYLNGSMTLSEAVDARVKCGLLDKARTSDRRYVALQADTGRVWGEMGDDLLSRKLTENRYATTSRSMAARAKQTRERSDQQVGVRGRDGQIVHAV